MYFFTTFISTFLSGLVGSKPNTTNITENDSDTNDSHNSDGSKSKSDSELY